MDNLIRTVNCKWFQFIIGVLYLYSTLYGDFGLAQRFINLVSNHQLEIEFIISKTIMNKSSQ